MPGGCDGTWKGRRLFSCPKMRGLFLPVTSVVREKEFYDNKSFSSKTRYLLLCYGVTALVLFLVMKVSACTQSGV